MRDEITPELTQMLVDARAAALELRQRLLTRPPQSMPTELVIAAIEHAAAIVARIDALFADVQGIEN